MKLNAKKLGVLLFVTCTAALRAQTLQIVLINGKTGKPIKDRYSDSIGLKIGDVRAHPFYFPTDKNGIATVRLTNNESEVNVPECRGMKVDEDKLMAHWNKADDKAFRKKYPYVPCEAVHAVNPVVLYGDSIRINMQTVYVPCWPTAFLFGSTTNFSTTDVLQHGVATSNTCGSTTVSANPGQLILFVRPPSRSELWAISN